MNILLKVNKPDMESASPKVTGTLGHYNLYHTLGKGAYSKVKLAYDTQVNQWCAIKLHKNDDHEFTNDIKSLVITEVKAIRKL